LVTAALFIRICMTVTICLAGTTCILCLRSSEGLSRSSKKGRRAGLRTSSVSPILKCQKLRSSVVSIRRTRGADISMQSMSLSLGIAPSLGWLLGGIRDSLIRVAYLGGGGKLRRSGRPHPPPILPFAWIASESRPWRKIGVTVKEFVPLGRVIELVRCLAPVREE
jgi:hypothetical protein